LKEVNEAGRIDDKERVEEILLRIENGFPQMLDDTVYEEIKPLIKQVRIVAQTWMAGETKDSACRIMGMWNKLIQFLNKQKKAKIDDIVTEFKFLENEQNHTQSWDQSLVIKNKSKRK
jgi:DNA-binding transcriptional regulator GbsR (MarR family)